MDFKYKTKFSSNARLNFGKWKEAKAKSQVFASLDDLRSLLPSDEEITDNPDLLYTGFNAAVVNLINANDHGIATDTALSISKYFVHRHMNLEHSRWDVIGHIISQGFSSFGENKILTPESLVGTKDPFNICLGAIVYKIVREYMAQIIEESADKDGGYFQMISASWEVGYNEYDMVLGSKKIADAEIVTDETRIKELCKYLKVEGGDGFLPDGTPAYLLIKGDARPLGCAFTNSPAAAVTGLFVPEIEDEKENDGKKHRCSNNAKTLEQIQQEAEQVKQELESAKRDLEEAKASLATEKNKNAIKDNDKNSSQINKLTVNRNMKLKSTEDITPEFLQTAEASVEVRTFISEQLKKTSDEFAEKVNAAEKDKTDVEASLTETKKVLQETKDELEKLSKQVEAKAKQEAFDARMEEISAAYLLNASQTTAVAAQIKDLDDAAFASWKTNFDLFATKQSEKSKEGEGEGEKETEAEKALKTVEASKKTLPNAQAPEANEFDTLVKNLSKAITINK